MRVEDVSENDLVKEVFDSLKKYSIVILDPCVGPQVVYNRLDKEHVIKVSHKSLFSTFSFINKYDITNVGDGYILFDKNNLKLYIFYFVKKVIETNEECSDTYIPSNISFLFLPQSFDLFLKHRTSFLKLLKNLFLSSLKNEYESLDKYVKDLRNKVSIIDKCINLFISNFY